MAANVALEIAGAAESVTGAPQRLQRDHRRLGLVQPAVRTGVIGKAPVLAPLKIHLETQQRAGKESVAGEQTSQVIVIGAVKRVAGAAHGAGHRDLPEHARVDVHHRVEGRRDDVSRLVARQHVNGADQKSGGAVKRDPAAADLELDLRADVRRRGRDERKCEAGGKHQGRERPGLPRPRPGAAALAHLKAPAPG